MKRPRLIDKDAKRKAAEQNWIKVRRQVDERDGMRCRICDRKVFRTVSAIPERREHHHIVPLSCGGKDAASNVIVICKKCHTERHVTRTLDISGTASRLRWCWLPETLVKP